MGAAARSFQEDTCPKHGARRHDKNSAPGNANAMPTNKDATSMHESACDSQMFFRKQLEEESAKNIRLGAALEAEYVSLLAERRRGEEQAAQLEEEKAFRFRLQNCLSAAAAKAAGAASDVFVDESDSDAEQE